MSESRHMTWSEIRSYMEADEPSVHVIAGDPKLMIRLPGSAQGMELLVPFEGDPPILEPLAEVGFDVATFDGREWIRLSTESSALFPLFYEFALIVSDRAQQDGVAVDQALREAVSSWRRLLQSAAMMPIERQTGLYGELLVLRRLELQLGADALDVWTGPTHEAHDFRLGEVELEVKTTRSEGRVHTINGANQLEPSPGFQLFIVSVQVAAAGQGGASLANLIGELRQRFALQGVADRFSALIENHCLVAPAMEQHYNERLKLRSPIALVPVDDDLPRITTDDIEAIPRPEMSRVSDVRFRLDLGGLGFSDGTSSFLAILPE